MLDPFLKNFLEADQMKKELNKYGTSASAVFKNRNKSISTIPNQDFDVSTNLQGAIIDHIHGTKGKAVRITPAFEEFIK